ncbi:hypothetical protein D499_0A04060 [Hanseniaspora uvarum DSM 2768]|nr:hypothetical protein D499_0A04060 [Hanseniaspora uvarum DSM 2768]
MVNKAKTYNPTAYNDAFLDAASLINTFDKEADAINLKKAEYFKSINYNPTTFQYARSRSFSSHPEFDMMNIENVINPNEKYDIVKFHIQNYQNQKQINPEQFFQNEFHAAHVSQHCQIIPSSFQSLNTSIRKVIKSWSNGKINSKEDLIGNSYNVLTYKNQTFDFRDLSTETKTLLDREMRLINVIIINAFLRQSEPTGFTVMVPERVMVKVKQDLFKQLPNQVSIGSYINCITRAKFPIKIIDTFEFDMPCKKKDPVVRFVSNYNFHSLWTYPVESMLTASKKKLLYSIYLSCEERKAFKKASELGVITFHPLLENYLMPAKRVKRASFTDRKNMCLNDLKTFEKDNFLIEKSDNEIVNSYICASNLLDPKCNGDERSFRFEDRESHLLYGGVKSKKMGEYIISVLSFEELNELDLKHQKEHENMINSVGFCSKSLTKATAAKSKKNSRRASLNQEEKEILANNKTKPIVFDNLSTDEKCAPLNEIPDLFEYINGFSLLDNDTVDSTISNLVSVTSEIKEILAKTFSDVNVTPLRSETKKVRKLQRTQERTKMNSFELLKRIELHAATLKEFEDTSELFFSPNIGSNNNKTNESNSINKQSLNNLLLLNIENSSVKGPAEVCSISDDEVLDFTLEDLELFEMLKNQ